MVFSNVFLEKHRHSLLYSHKNYYLCKLNYNKKSNYGKKRIDDESHRTL
jgi:hypothetical protein